MNVEQDASDLGMAWSKGGLAAWLAPQFRVITTGDKRRGVRLERTFWRLLDEIAGRRGLKRAGLVREALASDEASTESVASTLRCYVAATLEAERGALATRNKPEQLIALMLQAPMPAFAINRQKKLQQVNGEFMQLLRPLPTASTTQAADSVQLTLDTPIDELFVVLAGSPSAQCNYTLQVGDRRRRGRAKIALVPSETPNTLVGYVLL